MITIYTFRIGVSIGKMKKVFNKIQLTCRIVKTILKGRREAPMEEEKKANKKIDYINRWDKENRVPVSIRLRKREDADLIEVFRSIPNKAEWLRSCLRAEKEKAA